MDTGWRLVQEMFFVDVDTLHEIDISSVLRVKSKIYNKCDKCNRIFSKIFGV